MKALRITFEGGKSTFQELFHKENFASFFIFFKKQFCFNTSQEFANFGDRNVWKSVGFVYRIS